MKPKQVMLIAGEASGDLLAAELVGALRRELVAAAWACPPDPQPLHTELEPRFFGAGGPRMKAAGVELAFDLTRYSVIGLSDVLKGYFTYRRLFNRLYDLALERQPDAIVCVDFSGFNRRFAHAIKRYVADRSDWFHDWRPRIIQYVSPQVWASREGRAYQVARDYDLLLSIFPFEKGWYAKRVPKLKVEFVGHPILERYASGGTRSSASRASTTGKGIAEDVNSFPAVVLLPGSRSGELQRHVPVMTGAIGSIGDSLPNLRVRMVLPNESLAQEARSLKVGPGVEIQVGGLPQALAEADLAIASTGTVTMECAWFGVPTVTLYKTSWSNYQIARRIATVKWLAMPNILANEELFPEFIQNAATPENIARAALALLRDEPRRDHVKAGLAAVMATLGGPGATRRAAQAIARTLASAASSG